MADGFVGMSVTAQAVTPELRTDGRRSGRDVVIVGGGPTGVRAAQALSRRGIDATVLSAEPIEPYNRVQLTPLLAGDAQIGDIRLPAEFPGPGRVDVLTGVRAVTIRPEAQQIVTADGGVIPYHALVLATGSRPHVPAIPGADRDGVFVFRSIQDVSALIARSLTARRVVVIGGGLLGLEAARGMRRRGAETVVVEHESRLMPRQLDQTGGEALAARVRALGIEVMAGVGVAAIEGDRRVTGVVLQTGERLAADAVIVCTGVRAETGLAQAAGLKIGRGVVVDSAMRTSDPHIFAAGECAEHDGVVVGLVGPGLEQAETAARAIAGETVAHRAGPPVTKLKLVGADVFSVGPVEQLDAQPSVRSHAWMSDVAYRRIFLQGGRIVGAIGVGAWDEASRVQAAVTQGMLVYPWMVARFRGRGRIWAETEEDVGALPATAVVCNCTGVTAGRIREAAAAGAGDLAAIRLATGANTVCGTCAPLVGELLESDAPPEALRFWKPLVALSAVGGLAALITGTAPPAPIPDLYTVDGPTFFERLWLDGMWKQWSGYILLGLTTAALLLGLRKRIGRARWAGGFDWWRLVHLGLGVACTVGLFVHTGFRLGDNLNMALMLSYLATLVLGAVAGLATGGDHKLRANGFGSAGRPPKTLPAWLHILAIWPLPVLLAAHVASVYAF